MESKLFVQGTDTLLIWSLDFVPMIQGCAWFPTPLMWLMEMFSFRYSQKGALNDSIAG